MDQRKAIALAAYENGCGSNEAARLSGLSGGYIRVLTKALGISRPRGRPRKSFPGGAGRAQQAAR